MLNKKAIAAFAAGATLLAGFAVSAPAFATELFVTESADALAERLNNENKQDTPVAEKDEKNASSRSDDWQFKGEDADALAKRLQAEKDAKKDEKVAPKKEVKKGATLAKTGVSVALTALAASVLAGLGAALRKARH